MSAKPSSSRRTEPKLPPMEAIVTRNKSAQLKRQLRNKEESIKRISQITQQLRSPTGLKIANASPKKSRVSPKSRKCSQTSNQLLKLNKSQKMRRLSEKTLEYYPDKAKRSLPSKKVLLKPRQDLKVITGSGGIKRKMGMPRKSANPASNCSPFKSGLYPPVNTMQNPNADEDNSSDVDTASLTEDDLWEILTCESPVWWENPPDDSFVEDPICRRPITVDDNVPMCKIDKIESLHDEISDKTLGCDKSDQIIDRITDKNLELPETKQTDNKFMIKRTKLEKLLGNIKNKLLLIPKTDTLDKNVDNKIVTASDTKTDEVKKECPIKTETVDNTDKKIIEPSGFRDLDLKEEIPHDIQKTSTIKKEKKLSESTESDDLFSSLRDDDILRDLENMDIPIEDDARRLSKDCNIDEIPTTSKDKQTTENLRMDTEQKDTSATGTCKSVVGEIDFDPKLSMTRIDFSSPVSTKSVVSNDTDTTITTQDPDTISDTHISFLYESDGSKDAEKSPKSDDSGSKNSKSIDTMKHVKPQFFRGRFKVSNLDEKRIEKRSLLKKTRKSNLEQHERNPKNDTLDFKNDKTPTPSVPKSKHDSTNANEDIPKLESTIGLNTYYKKCKNTNYKKRFRISSIDLLEPTNCNQDDKDKETFSFEKENSDQNEKCYVRRSKMASDTGKVKYCLQRACIFETEECAYYVRGQKNHVT